MTLWSTNLPLPWRDSTVYCNLGSSKQFLWACVWGCAFMICACQCRRVWVCKCRHESGMLSSLYWNLDFLRSVLEYSTKKIWQMIIKHHLGHSYLKLCKLWRGGGVVCWFCFVDSRRKKYCRINVFLIFFFLIYFLSSLQGVIFINLMWCWSLEVYAYCSLSSIVWQKKKTTINLVICANASTDIDYAKLGLFLVPASLTWFIIFSCFFFLFLRVFNDSWGHFTWCSLICMQSRSRYRWYCG